MNLKDLIAFQWLVNFFRPDRAKWIRKLLPYAVPIAQQLAKRDWDNDGVVESARDEFLGLLAALPLDVLKRVFDEYLDAEGMISRTTVSGLPRSVLIGVLAMAKVAFTLVKRDEEVPSQSILETVQQNAYERMLAVKEKDK